MLLRKVILAGLILAVISVPTLAQKVASRDTTVYIGTLGETIIAAHFDQATGRITDLRPTAQISRPTWLALDPERPILYSVSELGNDGKETGSVYSFAIDSASGGLKQISKTNSGGHGPTYLSYDARVKTIFVANFGGGQVADIPVHLDGSLAPPVSVQTDYGHGPSPNQAIPHAHCAILDPGGHFLLTPDMGADRIFVYKYDASAQTLAPASPAFLETGPFTGPRHFVFSPNGRFVYVLTELSAEIRVFKWDAIAGQLHPVQSVSINPPNFKGTSSTSEIRVSADGRFIYAANRATSSIEVFAVDQRNGTLKQVQDIASDGNWPRSFAFDPSGQWMLVAHMTSKTITVFAIDRKTGKLSAVGSPVYVAETPAAFVFYQP